VASHAIGERSKRQAAVDENEGLLQSAKGFYALGFEDTYERDEHEPIVPPKVLHHASAHIDAQCDEHYTQREAHDQDRQVRGATIAIGRKRVGECWGGGRHDCDLLLCSTRKCVAKYDKKAVGGRRRVLWRHSRRNDRL
jgi:hypothetical protein